MKSLAAKNETVDMRSVLVASEGGHVMEAQNGALQVSSSGQVVVGHGGMRFEGLLDLTGVEVRLKLLCADD